MQLKPVLKLASIAVGLLAPATALMSAPSADLMLTENEARWLREHPAVSFTGDPNWLPFEAFDESGEYIGIVSEHLKLVSKLTGLEFRMSPSITWTESTEKARQGQVDVLSETDDSDLKSHLVFTKSYLSNPIVIAMHNRENYVENIATIEDRKIALIKDYGYASKIRRKYSQINFVTVDDIQSGLIAVSTGKVDALLCTLALCSYTIADLGLNNVRIVGKTEFDTKLALGVQKYMPELVSILNKAIDLITPGQQQAILDEWIRQKFVAQTDYTLAYQIAAISIILIGIFAFWNHRLSQEVSLRKATEKELKSAEEVLRMSHQRLLLHREQTPLGVIEWNTDFECVYWNDAAERIFGYTSEEILGHQPVETIVPESETEAVEAIWKDLLEKRGGERSTNENITKDGRTIQCEWYNTPMVNDAGKVIGVTSLVDDVTAKKQSDEVIWKQANFDTLTGLPNRNMFHDRLAQELKKSHRAGLPLALLLIDLDEFKEVNDTLGHDIGDRLLLQAGNRITSCVRESDTVARLGGDEFIIIVSEVHRKRTIDDIAEKIINTLSEAYTIGNEVIHTSGSIGITLYPDDAKDIDTLVKNADQAMYAAKENGRNCFSYFTQSLQDAAQKRLRLTNDLRNALPDGQFEIFFQPIVDLQTDRICKAEALLRWQHPSRGMVPPLEFIPLAENTSLIHAIGDWVFRQSVGHAKDWSGEYNDSFQITVNISPMQFKLDTQLFTRKWQKFLQDLGLPGQNLIVEITESMLLNADDEVVDKLLWMRDTGIQVAIDDFGTGYSSLSYLRKFDIDYLKIDKSFIHNLEADRNNIILSEAIIMMAHKLGLKVIAEGVETKHQKHMLIEAGCDYAQGYLFSRPVPVGEFETLLEHQPLSAHGGAGANKTGQT